MFKVAVVGMGYIAQNHLGALKAMDDVQICALVSRSEEKGKKAAVEYGGKWYATMEEAIATEKPDIVDMRLFLTKKSLTSF